MKLSQEEKAAHRAAFRSMSPKQKLEHIYLYYKGPILLGLLALAVLGSIVQQQLTKKEPLVYLALANVAVGEDAEADLTQGFLRYLGADEKKQEVYLYPDLYLSENAETLNHEYAYASRMKLMGAVSAGRLDLVLMNREAWDMLSRGGYLLVLNPDFFEDAALYAQLSPCLAENEVIVSDNSLAYQLGEAETHEVETAPAENGLAVSGLPFFSAAGFPDAVYLGVIANTKHPAACAQYMAYLLSAGPAPGK